MRRLDNEAGRWIRALDLIRHPEGGYYREIYRSPEIIRRAHLPARFDGDRCFATSVYFLLQGHDVSAFHRIRQDEIWHFYAGDTLAIHIIDRHGDYRSLRLGRDPDAGECLQAVVPSGELFAASVDRADSFALVGCTVAPGFEFADFDMPDKRTLLRQYPRHRTLIERLGRD